MKKKKNQNNYVGIGAEVYICRFGSVLSYHITQLRRHITTVLMVNIIHTNPSIQLSDVQDFEVKLIN